jgi:prepilin-type processing-associated H-X9-DG protein
MELVAFVCVVGTIAAILLPSLARSRESARRSSCQNNLKQMGLVLKMYANENAGVYPPMVPVNGVWTLDLRAVYPEYLTDPAVLFCPTSAESSGLPALMDALKRKPPDWERAQRLVGRQYVYLGWAFRDEQDFEGVLTGPPSTPCTDLKVGERTVYWLRDGVEKQLVEDKANAAETATQRSLIPVMCDNPACSPHKPGGVNVLYLDGHVEFLRLGSKFPALPSVARQFGGLPPEK